MDEVPLPFECFDGKTYSLEGERTIDAIVTNCSWTKRQATLVLTVLADSVPRVKPKLIFHGKEGGLIWQKERQYCDSHVSVELFDSAYNNEELLLRWLKGEFAEAIGNGERDTLLVRDSATFHKTETVNTEAKQLSCLLAVTPGGCTGLFQPLDAAINKPFKALFRDVLEPMIEAQVEDEDDVDVRGRSAISKRRITVVSAIAETWETFSQEKREVITDSFLHTGIAICPSGECDEWIAIKDLDNVDFSGWETQNEVEDDEEIEHKMEKNLGGFEWALDDNLASFLLRKRRSLEGYIVSRLKQEYKN